MESIDSECIVEWSEWPMEHSSIVVVVEHCMELRMELECRTSRSLEYGFARCSQSSELELDCRRNQRLVALCIVVVAVSTAPNSSQNEAAVYRLLSFL